MSNQLGNHKNVLGISSQSWAIILVPVLPGLPIHLFLAETMCLPIPLPYKKSPCSGQMLCTGCFPYDSFPLSGTPWGRGVCVRVCVCVCVLAPFPSPPLIYLLHVRGCVCYYYSLPFSSSLWRAFPRMLHLFTRGEKLEQQKGWMDKEQNGRQSFPPILPPSPAICHSPEWLWLAHTVGSCHLNTENEENMGKVYSTRARKLLWREDETIYSSCTG